MPSQVPLPDGDKSRPAPAAPLRAALVAWSFCPRVGGSVSTTLTLSRALAAKGIRVDIIAPLLREDRPKVKDLDLGGGITIHWVKSSAAGSYSTFRGRLVFLIKMAGAVRRLSPSVSVFHAQDFNVGLLAALLGSQKPVAACFGADPLLEALYYKKKSCPAAADLAGNRAAALLRGIARALLSLLGGNRLTVITCNPCSDREAEKYWRGPRITIPVGIDTERSGEGKPRENLVLFAARLVCWKGFEDAAGFFRAARRLDPALKMICIGEGPLLEYYSKKYAGEGIEFTGGLKYGELPGYYDRAKLLLVPSRYETFGIAVSEAMAAGLPIAATDLEAYRDRLEGGKNCLLVKDWGEKSAAEINALLRDAERLAGLAAAARDCIKAHDISLVSGRYAELYRSMAAGRGRAAAGS